MSAVNSPLTLALIVKNESRCLARCLRSVASIVGEIVVVDTGSTDNTLSIAQSFGAKIHSFNWINDFSAARNYALQQATGQWILCLDADEYASEALTREIPHFIASRNAVGRIGIVSEYVRNGQRMSSRGFVSRLFPKGAHYEGRIHEQLITPLPRENLKGDLLHDGYLDNKKSDRNVSLLLEELKNSPEDTYLLHKLGVEYHSTNQLPQALRTLEKAHSLIQGNEPHAPSIIVEYLYVLVETKQLEPALKVVERWKGRFEDFPDYHFVCGIIYMNLVCLNSAKYISLLSLIEQSFKRCLEIGETTKYPSVTGAGSFLALYNLGLFYHVLGQEQPAIACFTRAAQQGHEPSAKMLRKNT